MPLTEEEKKRRRAEKKAQKIREAEELRIKTRKEELGREVQNSHRNVAEYMKQWYLRNYAARFPHIVQDMEVAWHSFEHTLDVKDFIISELMDKMDESKIQEAMSWQDYIIKIDDMIGDFQERINELDVDYQGNLKKLVDEGIEMSFLQTRTQDNLEEYYKTILFIMENRFSEAMTTAQGEYLTKRDEQAKKEMHSLETMSAALENSLQSTVADIKDSLAVYKENTDTKRKKLEALKAKDDFYTDMIKRQDFRMAKLCDELSDLQSQVNARHDSQVALEDLKKDREETYAEYRTARASLNRETTLDNNQLVMLTSESNNVIQDLQRILEKGEKILRLGALCRRLETQEEKVFPFGAPIELKSDYIQVYREPVNDFVELKLYEKGKNIRIMVSQRAIGFVLYTKPCKSTKISPFFNCVVENKTWTVHPVSTLITDLKFETTLRQTNFSVIFIFLVLFSLNFCFQIEV